MATKETEQRLTALIDREQDAIGCPYPIFSALRDESPIHFSEKLGTWVCTKYEDIMEILHDTDRFSSLMPTGPRDGRSGFATAMEELAADPSMAEYFQTFLANAANAAVLLNADPPEHRRQRKAVNRAFRPTRLRGMEPMIEEVTSELLDEIIDKGESEFVSEFAVGLPMTIIAVALGVETDNLATFKKWSDDLVMPVGNPDPTTEKVRDYLISLSEFNEFFGNLLQLRREEAQEDIISDVANAEVNDEMLNEAEMLSMLQQFLVAGNETTTKLLTNLMHHLAVEDGLEERLRNDVSLIDNFIEEGLRFEAPVGGLFRMAKQDTTVGETELREGDHIWLIFAAANRDPEMFSQPDTFSVDRENARDHLAFGHGEHFCIGAMLARLEARIAVEHILERMENIRLIEGRNNFEYEDTFVLRGLKELHIAFDAR
ncbi:MAG: cytochrome P450 [Actinomycetota bacterium]|nr:cytochrome P450 [Actinomycetota bacterium]MED5264851.1 cytochrome P450 [Actinomycetota bacterium]|tara:strand:- start:2438 stop:3730 length:1293 start_codon:yes stop_codon:yes gene_type:complete